MNFVKFFRSAFFYNIYSQILQFLLFTNVLTQNNILKNLFKSYPKITVIRFLFSEVAGCEVTKDRTSIIVSFGWFFFWNSLYHLFSKTASGESFWRLSEILPLEEVKVFVQVNFHAGALSFIQIPKVWMRSNTCWFQ